MTQGAATVAGRRGLCPVVVAAAVSALLFGLPPNAEAGVTIYVDGTLPANCAPGQYSVASRTCGGNDGSGYRTFAAAVAAMQPGDTVDVRGGTYATPLIVNKSGTAAAHLRFRGHDGETAIIDLAGTTGSANGIDVVFRSYVDIERLIVLNATAYGLKGAVSSNITISDSEFGYSFHSGIYFDSSSDVSVTRARVHHSNTGLASWNEAVTFGFTSNFSITDSEVYDNAHDGINSKYGSRNGLIARNQVYRNWGPGIYLDSVSDVQVIANVCRDTLNIQRPCIGIGIESTFNPNHYQSSGLTFSNNVVYGSAAGFIFWIEDDGLSWAQFDHIRIDDNTIVDNNKNAWGGIYIINGTPSNFGAGNTIRNNIFIGNGGRGIRDFSGATASSFTVDHNLFWTGEQSTLFGVAAVFTTASPFVDSAAHNYHLTSDAAARLAGQAIADITTDIEGAPRPASATDIGAYQYESGPPPPLNTPPVAEATADVTSGFSPLTVHFDGASSSDPDTGDSINYSWDLNGDGTFGDDTGVSPVFTYTSAGTFSAALRVTDSHNATDTTTVVITVATPGSPIVLLSAPAATATYRVGDAIPFSGSATDPDDGLAMPASALTWRVFLDTCASGDPSSCSEVLQGTYTGVAGGTFVAPDQHYPSFLRFELTATKPGAPSSTVSQNMAPQTATVTLASLPSGLSLSIDGSAAVAPMTRTFVVNAQATIMAAASQTQSGSTFTFVSWSDGGGASHVFTAAGPMTLMATYTAPPAALISAPAPTATYRVGDGIPFSGSATEPMTGFALPASALTWRVFLNTCASGVPSSCTEALQGTYTGVAGGTFVAPDQQYPSFLRFELTATTADGRTSTVSQNIQPQTTTVTLASVPSGLSLTIYGATSAAPMTRTLIVNAQATVSAAASQTQGGTAFTFASWSDAGAASHAITATASPMVLTATYTAPPTAVMSAPIATTTYRVGDGIPFSGGATDPVTGLAISASALSWRVFLNSCLPSNPSSCTESLQGTYTGAAGGTFVAPNQQYPSFLRFELTATKSDGLTSSVSRTIQPQTTTVTLASVPSGLSLTMYGTTTAAPITQTLVVNAQATVSAAPSQIQAGTTFTFASWSDAGTASHTITATASAMTLTATYTAPPIAVMSAPATTATYRVGDGIPYSGNATDPVTGLAMPASALTWRVFLSTCLPSSPSSCTESLQGTYAGVAGGTFVAPDQQYPSSLRFELTATKSGGLSSTVSRSIQPQTTTVTLASSPAGLSLTIYGATSVAPITRTLVVNAQATVSAAASQTQGGTSYNFTSWSDSGAASHAITATASPLTLTATYTAPPPVWNSWDVVTQAGSPQGRVTNAATGVTANVEFYESTNDAGVLKGSLFGIFNAGTHADTFNSVQQYWGPGAGATYPYAGKSTVNRGSGTGETGAPAPAGVRDLQLHPPNNLHYTVAAFQVPQNGNYTISNLGARRVHNLGGSVGFHVLNAQRVELTSLQATASRAWVTSPTTYTLTGLVAGTYLYFAVDRAGDFFYDATEIAWTVTFTGAAPPPPPPPPPAPSCVLSVAPSTITAGASTTLSWTTTNATSLTINQGVGSVTPVASGSMSRTPSATTTYTGTATGAGGTASCSATVTVNPAGVPVWNSWDVVTQSGATQGVVTAAATGATASLEFYESTNNLGVAKGALFSTYNAAAHPETFNSLERYWGPGAGATYPYAGKSTTNRGAGTGETNAPAPLGVRDLQLHPPNNAHNTVAAFRVPTAGTYTVTNLGVRRISSSGGPVNLHLFNAQQVEIATLQATTNRAWVLSPTTYTLTNLAAGSYIYFGVDRGLDFLYDATEIAWSVTRTGP